MFDPIEILRRLPWRNLMAAGGMTVVLAMILDALLGTMLIYIPGTNIWLWPLLMAPQVGLIMSLIVSATIGVVALYLLETRFHPGSISLPTLWALVFCIMICLLFFWTVNQLVGSPEAYLPIRPLGWVGANQLEVVATAIGTLWYGRRYWR